MKTRGVFLYEYGEGAKPLMGGVRRGNYYRTVILTTRYAYVSSNFLDITGKYSVYALAIHGTSTSTSTLD